jgi:hypothetical protein
MDTPVRLASLIGIGIIVWTLAVAAGARVVKSLLYHALTIVPILVIYEAWKEAGGNTGTQTVWYALESIRSVMQAIIPTILDFIKTAVSR